MNYKLTVRCYDSGRRARCLTYRVDNQDYIISLENSFNLDGGLMKYSVYGKGGDDYKYDKLTKKELKTLKIEEIYRYDHMFKHQINISKEDFRKIVENYQRKEKLLKIVENQE